MAINGVQGSGGTGIFHMTLDFIFQQLPDPPLLPNAVCFIHMLYFLVKKTSCMFYLEVYNT